MRRKAIEKKLSVVYDDNEVAVYIAPSEEEAEKIILKMLKQRAMTLKEIHSVLTNLVSDEKIRRILRKLMEEKKIEFNQDTKQYSWKSEKKR